MGILSESRSYVQNTVLPLAEDELPDLLPRLAVGLVGNGSECYGFDDEQSLDHDCGIDFCLWVGEGDVGELERLRNWKQSVLDRFPPKVAAVESAFGPSRGPSTVKGFYRGLIGAEGVPENLRQWLAAPEENFSLATNGAVFYDGLGEFSATREALLGYFPENVRRKRMAAWCMQAAQAGQYNLARMWRRDDWVAVQLCKSRFIEAATALAFALSRTYRPYYKWTHRMMSDLSPLGAAVGGMLSEYACLELGAGGALGKHVELAERICELVAAELRAQRLSSANDTFLVAHGMQIQESIEDERLSRLPAQAFV